MVTGRLYVVVPTYKPVGGVIKTLDYAVHAHGAGREVVVVSPEPFDVDLPIARIDRLRSLSDMRHVQGPWFGVRRDEMVLFAWPTDYELIAPRLERDTAHERVVHLVQNVRHASPDFLDGYARRLLARPMTRIATNDIVAASIRPHAHGDSELHTIPLGHDVERFEVTRDNGWSRGPLRVGYTTWKSPIGDSVRDAMAGDSGYEFRSIRTTVGWDELAHLYRWADVFLAAPIREEGFYMPALEAMAAGCIVVTPDAGGNMTYCRFGENCVEVGFEEVTDYVNALRAIAEWQPDQVDRMRRLAHDAVGAHRLEAERVAAVDVLDRVDERFTSRRKQ